MDHNTASPEPAERRLRASRHQSLETEDKKTPVIGD